MNKSDLIDAIASTADLSKADAGRALNAVTDAITDSLSKGLS
jgi:DNA-binding protein HU-beta